MAENNYLRQVNTVPNFGVDLLFNAGIDGIPVGDVKTNHVVPTGKVIMGVIYRDAHNDLVGADGATVLVKVGGVALGTAVTTATIKGTSKMTSLFENPVVVGADGTVSLTVGAGAINSGDLDVVILYA